MQGPLNLRGEGGESGAQILGIHRHAGESGPFENVEIETDRGRVECRYYPAEGTEIGVAMVGGVGGDFDSPGKGLYPRLCEEFRAEGIASLRIQYRYPTHLLESVLDTSAGISFLESQGIRYQGLIGHSLGGAVVIQVAYSNPSVRTVVALSTQCLGTDMISYLPAETSILFIHGGEDEILPPRCSISAFHRAHEPKDLIIYEGAGHVLDEAAEQLHADVRRWVEEYLR